ncbi:MAG: TIGR00282 family metallophosphoesterase [Ruminococcaceae bacterium]|nr:TIGR00282 family metallophosphoesterase [Oscillospiraceae bacterium]
MNILFLGDVFAGTGRDAVDERLYDIKKEYNIDYTIANGENAAHGKGLSLKTADELLDAGVDFITLGNHAWSNNTIHHFIEDYPVIRPANFHPDLPGSSYAIRETKDGNIGILNLQGRVYMDPSDSPFDAADKCIEEMCKEAKIIIVDFHAEASSEKIALAHYLDGKVSAVLGTHTHVQTADERILPKGTAFITDVGMCGPSDSIIGMNTSLVLEKFVYNVPRRFEPASGKPQINAVVLDINPETGKAQKIERIFERL